MAIGGDILAVLLSLLLVGCFLGEGLRCGSRGYILAVLLSLSLVGCFFSEVLRCGSRGRYPCCVIVSLTGWLLL